MALDVWFRSDIQNALRAAEQASGAALRAAGNEHGPYLAGFQAGCRATLATIALAFGLLPSSLEPVGRWHRSTERSRGSQAVPPRRQGQPGRRHEMSKKWFGVGVTLFLITLAVVIGLRMNTEAMAVVIGVIFGVAASVPTSLVIVAVMWRREQRAAYGKAGSLRRAGQEALPPSVVIVSPGSAASVNPYRQPAYLPQPDLQWGQPPRQFRVVGDPEEASLDDGHYL